MSGVEVKSRSGSSANNAYPIPRHLTVCPHRRFHGTMGTGDGIPAVGGISLGTETETKAVLGGSEERSDGDRGARLPVTPGRRDD